MAAGVTLSEIIYDLWEAVAPQISDDSQLDRRKFKYWIHNQRSLWLRNELNKNRSIDDAIIQDLGCVELETVDASTCCGITTGCAVVRTVMEIPVTIERYNEPTITRVGPINPVIRTKNLNRNFPLIPYSRAAWANNSKYTEEAIYSFLYNKRIYLISGETNYDLKGLKYVNIRGVFENPEDAAKFTNCDGTACFSDDDVYPINRWMLNYMKDAIIKADLSIFMNSPMDTTNDDSPEIKDPNAAQKR